MGHMSLLAVCALGAVVPSVVHTFRLSLTLTRPDIDPATQSGLVQIPSCPANSVFQKGDEDSETCICNEGYEAVMQGTNQRLHSMKLELAGTTEQKWTGECRECGCSATKDKGYAYLLFEGGGVRGVAYGGAVKALEEADLLKHVQGFSGTSAGSQVAAFLAAGFSGDELITNLMNVDFKSLKDGGNLQGVGTVLTGGFGFYKGDALEKAMDLGIKSKTGQKATTFKQLWDHSCKVSCKELRVPAFNVNKGILTWFSAKTTPHVSVAKAVRASSSIPFFYQPAEIAMPDGGTYLFVDALVVRNFPHDAFDVTAAMPALGFILEENANHIQEKKTKDLTGGLLSFASHMLAGIAFGPDSANSLAIGSKAVDIRTINGDDVDAGDFAVDKMTRADLISRGYNAVFKHLEICKKKEIWVQTKQLEAEPKWLVSLLHESAEETMAAKVEKDWASKQIKQGTSDWWNMKRTKAAFSRYLVYNGEVQKTSEHTREQRPRGIEVLHIKDNVYIVTHNAEKHASPADRANIKDFFIVYEKQQQQQHTLPNASKQCFKFGLHKIMDMHFIKDSRTFDARNTKPVSIDFCGSGEEFVEAFKKVSSWVRPEKAQK